MCLAVPMQVRETGPGYAICEGMGSMRRVDTLLTGDQAPGTWLLVFLDSAREVLNEAEALRIADAVRAVELIMNPQSGDGSSRVDTAAIEALFADLVDREPPKPDSLIALERDRSGAGGD